MNFRFDFPLDDFQRVISEDALRRAGAPFDPGEPEAFREGVRRVWGYYQALMAHARPGGLHEVSHRLDRMLYNRRREEYVDADYLAPHKRERIMRYLDRFNRLLRSYDWFLHTLKQHVRNIPPGELSILDIGSGHGAFPIRLAREGTLAGHRLNVVGSDIASIYVHRAQELALKSKVRIEFRIIDALQLHRLEERFDVITSSQTIHHFPPHFLAELMVRARQNARYGVIFFDDRRGPLTLLGGAVGTTLIGRDRLFVHDAVVSVRRMYSPAELDMLARCAPGGEAYRAQNLAFSLTVAEAKLHS